MISYFWSTWVGYKVHPRVYLTKINWILKIRTYMEQVNVTLKKINNGIIKKEVEIWTRGFFCVSEQSCNPGKYCWVWCLSKKRVELCFSVYKQLDIPVQTPKQIQPAFYRSVNVRWWWRRNGDQPHVVSFRPCEQCDSSQHSLLGTLRSFANCLFINNLRIPIHA